MKRLYSCKVHALTVMRSEQYYYLYHHGKMIFRVKKHCEEHVEVFKKMYNAIVENHKKLNINYAA